MAIGSGTFTLADYALYSNQPAVQAVSMSLIDYGNIIQDIPMVTKQTLQANGVRFEGNLPTINWSALNAEGVSVHAQPTPYQEQAFVLRSLGTTGGLDESKDQFNRTITSYKNAVIRDPGVKADQTTRIIAGNAIPVGTGSVGETAAGVDSTGSSANFTSIYAVNYGTDYFFGWQFSDGPNVEDLGLINNA